MKKTLFFQKNTRKGCRFFMNLSLSEELHLFSQELQRFLSPIVLQDIAKQVGSVQRSSKYQANELIALWLWLSQEIASTSLTQLCSRLEASTVSLMGMRGQTLFPNFLNTQKPLLYQGFCGVM